MWRSYANLSVRKLQSGCATRSMSSTSPSACDFLAERNRWEPLVSFEHQEKATAGDEICFLAPVIIDSPEWKQLESKYPTLLAPEGGSSFTSMRSIPLPDGLLVVPIKDERQKSLLSNLQPRFRGMKGLIDRIPITKDSFNGSHKKLMLPEGSPLDATNDCLLSYLLDNYSFDRYKTRDVKSTPRVKLWFPTSDRTADVLALARATYLVQDLISTPAMDLSPQRLQQVAQDWAAPQPNVSVETIVGRDLLSYNGSLQGSHGCGMIYAVGRAASHEDERQPRLIRLQYTPPTNGSPPPKKIALVGKGVTHDTGGLNLKPGASMLHMKKDMGGAAHAMGLMFALVEQDFPVPVDCWIPAVENVVGAQSYRPGDVLTSVLGTTTEIGNTDAEGRLILADALALATCRGEDPSLVIDFATLTGAARVAMGTDVVPYFCNRDDMSMKIMEAACQEKDPMWPLPLWSGYQERIRSSKIADLRNVPSDNGLGGAITAALYLQEFIGKEKDGDGDETQIPWVHIDVYGVDGTTGIGLAQSLRAMYRFLWNHALQDG